MPEQMVREVMTANPVCLESSATVMEAAQRMRDEDIGDVIVIDGSTLAGIVTDRDLVVRVLAEEMDPRNTRLGEVATKSTVAVRPDQPISEAVRLMREHALRRLPVADESGKVIGIVTLGDLARERDPSSALSDISEAPPNN